MGTWFPGFRTATAEQVQRFRAAHQDLFRNSRYEVALRSADGNPR
jgi:hypothetical protein